MKTIEEVRDFWQKAPCEAWHGTAEPGSLAWSNEITKQRYLVQPHIRSFAEFDYTNAGGFPWWENRKVLEIGCGVGTDTLEFCRAGAIVYAGDLSEKSVEITYARCMLHRNEWKWYPWVHVFNAEEWLPHGMFDLIWSFGVLHHTPNPDKVLKRACDVLLPDGELRIMLYAKWSWKHLFTRQQPEAQAGCPLVRWYSEREARNLIESCGFKVVSVQKTHIFPWKIAPYTHHRYEKAFPWNVCPQWLFEWLETKLGHHLLIKAIKKV